MWPLATYVKLIAIATVDKIFLEQTTILYQCNSMTLIEFMTNSYCITVFMKLADFF